MTEYTGTGERAAPPYAVTAAALLADCRAALGDIRPANVDVGRRGRGDAARRQRPAHLASGLVDADDGAAAAVGIAGAGHFVGPPQGGSAPLEVAGGGKGGRGDGQSQQQGQ